MVGVGVSDRKDGGVFTSVVSSEGFTMHKIGFTVHKIGFTIPTKETFIFLRLYLFR